MQQRLPTGTPTISAPRFYITGRQRLSVRAILLAIVAAAAALSSVLYALAHNGHANLASGSPGSARSAGATSGGSSSADDKDDPSQVDTIVLGDPTEPPAPARAGQHVSSVHPTIVVRLPRSGDQVGLIPNTPAGRLLYAWLAAFNHSDPAALANALPTSGLPSTVDAQMQLRQQTGGFALISAKEVQPGILVFRVRDQTPSATEALGALQMHPNSNPAAIATFSLGAVPASPHKSAPVSTQQ